MVSSTWARHGVVSSGRGMTEAFDLSSPSKPVRTGAWPWADQTGACNWHNGLLLFGADGFASIDGEGRLKPAGPACEGARVADAIVGADVVYALMDEALEVRSLRLWTDQFASTVLWAYWNRMSNGVERNQPSRSAYHRSKQDRQL